MKPEKLRDVLQTDLALVYFLLRASDEMKQDEVAASFDMQTCLN